MKKIIVVMVAVIALMLTGCGNSSSISSEVQSTPEVVPQEFEGTYNPAFVSDGNIEVTFEELGCGDSKIVIQGNQIGIKLGDSETVTTYTVLATYDDFCGIEIDDTDIRIIVNNDGSAGLYTEDNPDVVFMFRKVV